MLNKPIFDLQGDRYLTAVLVIAPLLNFLFGISIDLYTPALPEITDYFHTSILKANRGVYSMMFGFVLGCFALGPMMDDYGRRRVILLTLPAFIGASLLATYSQIIQELSLLRAIQGIAIAASSVGSRVLIFDNFTGKRYAIGILYTSFAYAVGPVIAPMIGGRLEYYFGWKSVFIAYALLGLIVFALFAAFIKESTYKRKKFSLKGSIKEHLTFASNKLFLSGSIILGITVYELMSFSIYGSHFFENKLSLTSIEFGDTVLLLGISYLVGSLTNRLCIPYFSQKSLCSFGITLLLLSVAIYLAVALNFPLSKWSLVAPTLSIIFSGGFIFPNVLATVLKLYPDNVGAASASQSMLFMFICMVITGLVNQLKIETQIGIAILYTFLAIIQGTIFFRIFVQAYPPSTYDKPLA